MPYPSSDILADAAADLAGSHPLTIVTIPALLHAARLDEGAIFDVLPLPTIPMFGTKQERPVLEAFRLREGARSPYLAVWQAPPIFIRSDYPGSTLQRLRTQDLLGQQLFEIDWNEDHTKRTGTALRPTAGEALAERNIKSVNRLSLALWLGRNQDFPSLDSYLDWFDDQYPLRGTDLDASYPRGLPAYAESYQGLGGPTWGGPEPASLDELIARLHPVDTETESLDVPSTTPPRSVLALADTESEQPSAVDDLAWTKDFCAHPLRNPDVHRIVRRALDLVEQKRLVLPDSEALLTRCITALLVGHLVLQGPPGTGKTTLARILAEAFDVVLLESTATSEWSPFHVVGGLRPGSDNSLKPSYGKVADAVLKCAIAARTDVNAEAEGSGNTSDTSAHQPQGVWLLIDEFNRADIDKAIGSLYTMLSSCEPSNLERSPIDLWFEEEGRQQLWVPSRFRIIAAMNDLDTSFVNPISQGLTRRFQFITVGTPTAPEASTGISPEIRNSFDTAFAWLSATYGAVLTIDPLNSLSNGLEPQIMAIQELVEGLRVRTDDAAGWPVGTAQIVDVFRVLLLQVTSGVEAPLALDWAVADRVVPQMGQLDDAQRTRAEELFDRAQLPTAREALEHLMAPYDL